MAKHTDSIACRLAPDLRRHIEAMAKQNGVNLSAILRQMLQDGVERHAEAGR